jgi:D-proline reductase (dithiol) PrdB
MTEKRTAGDKFGNWFFGIPVIAQLWAKRQARRTAASMALTGEIPFTRLSKPLSACRAALVTTGGIHLPEQTPFDMDNPEGDATYREIPGDVSLDRLTITHKYYNHTDADADPNIIFPLDRFRELAAAGVIGSVAPRHFSFMGHIEGDQLPILLERTAPEVAGKLRADGVDFAFLTPA